MTKAFRRTMLFVAVVSFLVTAPILVLYAMGYRLSATADPAPMGVLLVESTPRAANVFANNEYSGRAPEAVSNLANQTVGVRVELDGYDNWQKQLSILPGRTTEARDIRLFPTSPQKETVHTAVEQFSVSPSRELIAIWDGRLSVIDTQGLVVQEPVSLSKAPTSMLWSSSSDQILIQTADQDFFLADISSSVVPRRVFLLKGATNVVWDPRVPGRLLYIDSRQNLMALNVENSQTSLLQEDVDSFAISSRHIFTLRDNELTTMTLQGRITEEQQLQTSSPVEKILVTPTENIALLLANAELFLLEEKTGLVFVARQVQDATWSPDNNLLLVRTDTNSLHVYNYDADRIAIAKGQLELVARFSRAVTDPQWFAGSRHLLYQLDDEIHIIEIDVRDRPIDYLVDTTNLGQAKAAVGADGQSLLYLKRNANRVDLAGISLVVPEEN